VNLERKKRSAVGFLFRELSREAKNFDASADRPLSEDLIQHLQLLPFNFCDGVTNNYGAAQQRPPTLNTRTEVRAPGVLDSRFSRSFQLQSGCFQFGS
jgi:hypothetical protein